IKLVPSYGNSPLDADIAIALIKAKRLPIKEMITHRLPLQDIGLGFKLVSEGNESIKVVIEPNG
ncbi:MAG: alcohol dehydrogenase, partial [Candidatus Omnitrophica bacterium]|nr:alcohol dehydrogenase [Candidatus Omnitrophota bacterium]